MIRVYPTTDNDGHWYVIPYELKDEFYELLEDDESIYDGRWDKFEKYMTGGALSLFKFYGNIDE